MDVRCQLASVFVLDKCTGCHACSVSCKRLWTDRSGAEHMAWSHVETRPGAGYPQGWEDQDRMRGGWVVSRKGLRLRSTSRARYLLDIIHQPRMPTLGDYCHPWRLDRTPLRDRPEGPLAPESRLLSAITGREISPRGGPAKDDDWSDANGSGAGDPNLRESRDLYPQIASFFHLPRICNQCVNPSCVAACPSGAAYKRGEDGIVAIDKERCRAWNSCIPACPYKAVFYNWRESKSEKCHLCFPLIESGSAPACFDDCPGRLRFQGILLYDASRIRECASLPPSELLEGMSSLILDPHGREVAKASIENGISLDTLELARRSPVYRFFMEWRLALPLHVEWRTLPMTFYVPPTGRTGATVRPGDARDPGEGSIPLGYLASLFSAGDEAPIRRVLQKWAALREFHRTCRAEASPRDLESAEARLARAGLSRDQAISVQRLLSAPGSGRVLIPSGSGPPRRPVNDRSDLDPTAQGESERRD
jgi:nitrate reductase / nitrite oxidoreductase, beta subunit